MAATHNTQPADRTRSKAPNNQPIREPDSHHVAGVGVSLVVNHIAPASPLPGNITEAERPSWGTCGRTDYFLRTVYLSFVLFCFVCSFKNPRTCSTVIISGSLMRIRSGRKYRYLNYTCIKICRNSYLLPLVLKPVCFVKITLKQSVTQMISDWGAIYRV